MTQTATAAEIIQAAIDSLETQRAATPDVKVFYPGLGEYYGNYDLGLVETLYRTIDAQLAILRHAHRWAELYAAGRVPDSGDNYGLDLARAILEKI